MRWTKQQDSKIISLRGDQLRIGEFIQCCLPHNVNVNFQGVGEVCREQNWPQAGLGLAAVGPAICFPAEVEEATKNRHTSPGHFPMKSAGH